MMLECFKVVKLFFQCSDACYSYRM